MSKNVHGLIIGAVGVKDTGEFNNEKERKINFVGNLYDKFNKDKKINCHCNLWTVIHLTKTKREKSIVSVTLDIDKFNKDKDRKNDFVCNLKKLVYD